MSLLIQSAILLLVYVGGFFGGSLLLRRILRFVDPELRTLVRVHVDFHDTGTWIGLCEHVLIVSFVLVHEYTAVGVIFAAKELVRSDKIRERPSYYLLGTLLNVTFALTLGLLARLALNEVSPR